jgi:hypothetical protein
MTHSDLKEMCRGYGLVVRHILDIDDEHLIYDIVPHPFALTYPPLGALTTTELHEMSASELEDLVVGCSVRSMEGVC